MDNALLASLNVSIWSIARQDRRINSKVAEQLGLGSDAGKYTKNRLDPKSPEWLAVTRARDNARNAVHYAMTIPWAHNIALLNALALEEYLERMEQAKVLFDAAVDRFMLSLEDQKAMQKLKLGEYYRESDYADLQRDSFSFDVVVQPIVHDAHFDGIAEIVGTERAQELAQALKDQQTKQWTDATKNVWERVYKALSHASNQLHNGQRLHDSVMENLQELTDLLPVLNINQDPDMEQARKDLVALFKSYSAMSVKDRATRSSCATEVDKILSNLPF